LTGAPMTAPIEAPVELPLAEGDPATEDFDVTDRPWIVIDWNDPVNLMSYVVFVLQKLFGYSREKATRLMLQVHHDGKAAVALRMTDGKWERRDVKDSRRVDVALFTDANVAKRVTAVLQGKGTKTAPPKPAADKPATAKPAAEKPATAAPAKPAK